MTIEEIRQAKRLVEQDILVRLTEFYKLTGLRAEGVEVSLRPDCYLQPAPYPHYAALKLERI